ncbi:hypothetical protein LTS06_012720, partial [Exophiala xenobiotica]
MLDSMKTKLILSDFATSVAGFEMFLRATLAGSPYRIRAALTPSKKSLQDLILAMNQLGRIAEEDSIETVDVRLEPCYAPWTCAFIKWLLGIPPLVRTAQGKTLLQQDNASVTLTILSEDWYVTKRTADVKAKLQVVPVQNIRSLREIIFRDSGTSDRSRGWQGL